MGLRRGLSRRMLPLDMVPGRSRSRNDGRLKIESSIWDVPAAPGGLCPGEVPEVPSPPASGFLYEGLSAGVVYDGFTKEVPVVVRRGSAELEASGLPAPPDLPTVAML